MKEIKITLNEEELKKLAAVKNVSAEELTSDNITDALHNLIENYQPEFIFEVECKEYVNAGPNGDDEYWTKGETYSVSTSDFKEFIAESNYGDAYLSPEDLNEYFDIGNIESIVLKKGLELASEDAKSIFERKAATKENNKKSHEPVDRE